MSNDNSLELTGSLARKRLLPSVSEVVRGLSAQVQADPAVVFRAARQVVADELIRVKQGFEAASADVLVARARAILDGATPDMTPTPPPPMTAPPERPFVSTQPLPQISSNDPFVETTGALDLRWDRDVKDPLAEPAKPAAAGASAPFGLPAAPAFPLEPTPPPVFEMTPLGLPETPPPPLEAGALWPADGPGNDTLEKEAASVSLTDVLPPVEGVEKKLPDTAVLTDFDAMGKPEIPFAGRKETSPLSPGAADLPPGWLDRDPMDVEATVRTPMPDEEPPAEPVAPVFMPPQQEPKGRLPFFAAIGAVLVVGAVAVWWFLLRQAPPAPAPEPVKTATKKPVVAQPATPSEAPGTATEAPSVSTPPVAAPVIVPTSIPEPKAPTAVPAKPTVEPTTPPKPTAVAKKPEPTVAAAVQPTKPAAPVKTAPPAPVVPAPAPVTVAQAPKSEPGAPVKQTRAGTLTSKDWAGKQPIFVIHFSSFKDQKSADLDSGRIGKKIGIVTRVVSVDLGEKGTWFRVVAGDFASFQEAFAFRQQLEEQKTPGLGLVYKMVGQP